MRIEIDVPYALNEQGGRTNNEDAIFPEKGKATPQNRFFILCDGVGGLQAGEIASRTVAQSMAFILEKKTGETFSASDFQQALDFAYEQLDVVDVDHTKMGTTLAFLYLHANGAFIAHIGDSRIYHFRKSENSMKLLYRSQDHSLVNDMLRAGLLTEDEVRHHAKKNVITRAIQPHQTEKARADIFETQDIRAGDCFFLCTDGILEQIDDSLLSDILSEEPTPKESINRIYSICEGRTKDNFSAYLVPIESVTA